MKGEDFSAPIEDCTLPARCLLNRIYKSPFNNVSVESNPEVRGQMRKVTRDGEPQLILIRCYPQLALDGGGGGGYY